MTLFVTQREFCSFDGGSISLDISCKEYKITQIAQVTLHLIKLWTGLISVQPYTSTRKMSTLPPAKFAYKEVKSADSNV